MDDLGTPGHVTPVVGHVTQQAGHVTAPLADNQDDTISTVSQEKTTSIIQPLSDDGDSETLSVADLFIMQASSDCESYIKYLLSYNSLAKYVLIIAVDFHIPVIQLGVQNEFQL